MVDAVQGPYNVFEALASALPKTLYLPGGVSVAVAWHPRRRMPQGLQPRANPHGVFEILRYRPKNAVSAAGRPPYREALTAATYPFAYATGTLSYLLEEEDVAAVSSVTGTVGGSPHTFVANTDYTFTVDSLVFTSGGTKPDNGTQVTVQYTHRLYYPRRAMDGVYTCRAILRCADGTFGGREYPKEALAPTLSDSLVLLMRNAANTRLTRPASPSPAEPYTGSVFLGDVLTAQPIFDDESGTIEAWAVDFTVEVAGIFELAAVRSILDIAEPTYTVET